MEFLFNVLSRADIFGHPITLNLELRSKYQSTVGGFISLAITILLGAYTINEIIGYVNARTIAITTEVNFSTYSETLFSYDPGQLILQSKQFMFAIYMKNLWEAPAYDIRVQILGLTNSTQQLKKCSHEQFEQVVNTNLSDLFIFDEWLCPKQFKILLFYFYFFHSDNFTLNLIGSKLALGSNKFQYLQISITECIEQTQWGVECGKDISLPTDVHFLTTNNYLNPTQNGIVADSYVDSSLIFNFQPQVFHQRIDYTFQNHYIQDYNGQIKIQGLVNPEEIQNVPTNSYQYIPVGLVQQEYTIINFFLGNFKTQYSRDYQTITDLLSKIGGLFQSIIGIAGFLISYYNRQKFYAELSNKLYDFNFDQSYQSTKSSKSLEQQIKESQIKRKRKKKGKKDEAKEEVKDEVKDDNEGEQVKEDSQDETPGMREKIQNVLSQHHDNAREFKNQKHFLLTMFQNIIMTKEQLNLSFRYFLYKITCRQTKKDDTKLFILQRAIGRVQKELDVFSILERLHQVEKLKRILFDKDQLILFNYSPKPIISIHDEKDTMDFIKYQKTFTSKRTLKDIAHEVKIKLKNKFLNKEDVNIEEIYNSYRSIAEQNRSSTRFYYKINNKLKDYLGSQLKAIFKASKLINFDDYNKDELAIQSDIAIENLAKTPRNLIITRPTSNNKTKIEFFRDI